MKAESDFCFIHLARGILTSEEFVEQNRKLLAKLFVKSYQVFATYEQMGSVSYFVIHQGSKGELAKELQKIGLELAANFSFSEAYEQLPPDSIMGKWAMSLIAKS